MAKVIKLLSEKGGTGKSTIAHLVGHGLGSLPRPIDALVITADPDDEVLADSRRYFVGDGRDHAALPALLDRLQPRDRLVVIIDAPAGRDLDDLPADLTILPFTPAHHDAQRAARQIAVLPETGVGVLVLPNRWPSHPARRKAAEKLLDQFPTGRIMSPLDTLGPVADLLSPALYGRVASPLSRPAQTLALEVLFRLGRHPFEMQRP